jgi:hypothetical protein
MNRIKAIVAKVNISFTSKLSLWPEATLISVGSTEEIIRLGRALRLRHQHHFIGQPLVMAFIVFFCVVLSIVDVASVDAFFGSDDEYRFLQ